MKISKDKRNQLILVLFCTVAALVLMWFYLIRPRYRALSQITAVQKTEAHKLADIQSSIKQADSISAQLDQQMQALSNAESDMASGDLYSWTFNTLRQFKSSYPVEIPDIGHPAVTPVDLLPDFPFKQVKFTVTGTAYYHDLGKFISDLENRFPHMRIVNVQLQPADTGGGEKLLFKMDIIELVKSTAS